MRTNDWRKLECSATQTRKVYWKVSNCFFFLALSLPRVRFCELYRRAKYLIMLWTLMNWLDNSILKQFYSETIKTKYNTQKRTQYHKICLVNLEIILIMKLFVFSYTAFKIYFFSLLLLAIFDSLVWASRLSQCVWTRRHREVQLIKN